MSDLVGIPEDRFSYNEAHIGIENSATESISFYRRSLSDASAMQNVYFCHTLFILFNRGIWNMQMLEQFVAQTNLSATFYVSLLSHKYGMVG